MLLAGLRAEGIDPIAVGHPHLHQILLMAPENGNWERPLSRAMVEEACVLRRVRNYESLLDSMTAWLNSPPAAWLFLYLRKQVFLNPLQGPSARLRLPCVFNAGIKKPAHA